MVSCRLRIACCAHCAASCSARLSTSICLCHWRYCFRRCSHRDANCGFLVAAIVRAVVGATGAGAAPGVKRIGTGHRATSSTRVHAGRGDGSDSCRSCCSCSLRSWCSRNRMDRRLRDGTAAHSVAPSSVAHACSASSSTSNHCAPQLYVTSLYPSAKIGAPALCFAHSGWSSHMACIQVFTDFATSACPSHPFRCGASAAASIRAACAASSPVAASYICVHFGSAFIMWIRRSAVCSCTIHLVSLHLPPRWCAQVSCTGRVEVRSWQQTQKLGRSSCCTRLSTIGASAVAPTRARTML